jgi:hypothetical protein
MIMLLIQNLQDIYIHFMICMFCTCKFSKTARIFNHTNDNVADSNPVGHIYIYIYIFYDMYVLHRIFNHTNDNVADSKPVGHIYIYTGLFISPSGISELDCATTKTDTVERSISTNRESLQVFFFLY